jgi:glucose/arabinose dehydrogenase
MRPWRALLLGLSLGTGLLLLPAPPTSHAGTSLRFHGNGTGDIDRVKIAIDNPARPADVGATDFTLEWWMKALPGENTSQSVTCNANDGWITGNILFDRDVNGSGDHGDFGVSLSDGRVAFGVSFGGSGNTICGTTDVTDGRWHHVAVTRRYSDGALRIFVDGVLDAAGPRGSGVGANSDVSYRDGRSGWPNDPFLVIGAEKHDAGSSYPSYRGWIDEVRLSNTLRYVGNFTRPNQPFITDANTVALYHFDEGSGDAVGDASGAIGGPSHGIRRFGGAPSRPLWSTDAAPLGGASLLALEPIATGLSNPVALAHAGDGSGRLFIVEVAGRIKVHDGAQVLPTPFLDISPLVSSGGERGLLGLAFHPDYVDNGYFYVYYTTKAEGPLAEGTIVIARYQVSGNPQIADAGSRLSLVTIPHPGHSNHNGGQLAFGPDGYLYAGVGDGGGGGDPDRNAQDLGVLLGKVLRIDVDATPPYIPVDNPFVGTPGARGEIWALGLRNPWRLSFDRVTGDLFIGDVGQGSREEVDFESAGSPGGLNYCWSAREGSLNHNGDVACTVGTPTVPILEYATYAAGGCAVTGGYLYRGVRLPGLHGVYVYGDYCSGRILGGKRSSGGVWTSTLLLDTDRLISTFGEDEAGELYIAHNSAGAGAVYRLGLQPPVVQSLTANRALPVAAGTTITWTATATGGVAPLQYRFWRYRAGVWTLARDYSREATYTWTTGAGDAGQYDLHVWVRNAGSTAAYDAYRATGLFTITGPAPPVVQSLTANRALPVAAGTTITWTATATGGVAPLQYRFWRFHAGSGRRRATTARTRRTRGL